VAAKSRPCSCKYHSLPLSEASIAVANALADALGSQQRLGTIGLKQTNNEDIADLFEWACIASDAATDAKYEITALRSELEEQKATVSKLNQQLEDLIKAKAEHENALLQKFTELLNSKKLKIRDQQRLLATAKVDPRAGKNSRFYYTFPCTNVPHKPRQSRRHEARARHGSLHSRVAANARQMPRLR
jgi:DNA double-strand break repair and V(D)J recombination protein XRCC4